MDVADLQIASLSLAVGYSAGITLSGNLTVTGAVSQFAGTIKVGSYTLRMGSYAATGPAARLQITTGNIYCGGAFTLLIAGNFSAGSSTLYLNGSADQTISTGSATFNNITIENTGNHGAGTDDVVVSGALDVNGTLTITTGDLNIDTTVNLAKSLSIASGGYLTKGSGAWTFLYLAGRRFLFTVKFSILIGSLSSPKAI